MSHYLIGIDLGTTNIALAYVDVRKARRGQPEIKTYAIPQLVAAGEMGVRPLLPSFIYLPGPHDLPSGATALPWDTDRREVVGEFAQQSRGEDSGSTHNVGEVVAVPRRCRSLGAAFAMECPAGCPSDLARRRFGSVSPSSRRKLERHHRTGQAG